MVERAIATKLVLRALDQSESIGSLDDRKRLQKLIYLVQAAGVNLGYGYSWYLKGPYSSALAKDYYNMPPTDLGQPGSPVLRPDVLPNIELVRRLASDFRRPAILPDADWLEIVSSVHYLERVSGLDEAAANDKLRREKPHLVQHVGIARNVVNEYFPKAQTR
jgi:hypothetical protein